MTAKTNDAYDPIINKMTAKMRENKNVIPNMI